MSSETFHHFSGAANGNEANKPLLDGADVVDSSALSSKPNDNTKKGRARRKIVKLAKATGLTAVSLAATEAAAHVVGLTSAALPHVTIYSHNPWIIGSEIAASYVPLIPSLWKTSHEAVVREDEGKGSYNVFASGLRNSVRKVFPNRPRLESAAEQIGGFSPHGALEGWYWAGVANTIGHLTAHDGGVSLLGGALILDQRSAAFIVGANVGGAVYSSWQTDASQFNRERGIEPKGIRRLTEIPRTIGGVAQIKYHRNVERAQRIRERVIYRSK